MCSTAPWRPTFGLNRAHGKSYNVRSTRIDNGKESAVKRQLGLCALVALVVVPDWASACWPRGGEPVYYYAMPVYYAPPVYCQPVYVQPCVPSAPPMFPPPRIEPVPRPGSSLGAPRPILPARPAQTESAGRPIANVDVPKPIKPDPAPAPMISNPKVPVVEIPRIAPEPKQPVIELPKVDTDPKLPTLELPKLPAIELPKIEPNPKLPGLEQPGVPAIPVPAPAPDPLIPPSAMPVPKNSDTLPPLTLPPDTPLTPDAKPVEAKSSPLTAVANRVKVSVFPASGAPDANGLRKVGFYNHTDRDLSLTIEGKVVTLPAKTYILAQLPATFTWKHGDKPVATETVPADATGIDVLFRSE